MGAADSAGCGGVVSRPHYCTAAGLPELLMIVKIICRWIGRIRENIIWSGLNGVVSNYQPTGTDQETATIP